MVGDQVHEVSRGYPPNKRTTSTHLPWRCSSPIGDYKGTVENYAPKGQLRDDWPPSLHGRGIASGLHAVCYPVRVGHAGTVEKKK